MSNQWILLAIISGVLFAVVGIVWLVGYWKLRRIRTLRCPDCDSLFVVASLTTIRRWMDFDFERGSTQRSGFYLHCDRCRTDYRFADDYHLLGRAEQKAENPG
mgnify:CR=1 FL=1